MLRLFEARKKNTITLQVSPQLISTGSEKLPIPPGVFGDGEAMAGYLTPWLHNHYYPGRLAVRIFVNTRQTILRVVPSVHTHNNPLADTLTGYVFGQCMFTAANQPSVLFIAALPQPTSDALVKMCLLSGIRIKNIKQIDVIEHRLLRQYAMDAKSICLCLPQENGVRVLLAQQGIPTGIYFISNDPAHRTIELNRIWLTHPSLPGRVLIFSSCNWLKEYFSMLHLTAEEVTI
jgi:hypothetical protein